MCIFNNTEFRLIFYEAIEIHYNPPQLVVISQNYLSTKSQQETDQCRRNKNHIENRECVTERFPSLNGRTLFHTTLKTAGPLQ